MSTGPEIITAPWSHEQVEALNAFQRSGAFHPFTCANRDTGHRATGPAYRASQRGVLVATPDGWICRDCDYTQDWAHDFMADPASLSPSAVSTGQPSNRQTAERVWKATLMVGLVTFIVGALLSWTGTSIYIENDHSDVAGLAYLLNVYVYGLAAVPGVVLLALGVFKSLIDGCALALAVLSTLVACVWGYLALPFGDPEMTAPVQVMYWLTALVHLAPLGWLLFVVRPRLAKEAVDD